mgnify:CR=1 FL=1
MCSPTTTCHTGGVRQAKSCGPWSKQTERGLIEHHAGRGASYENSRDYDCCQIIEGAYTVGDAVYEAYCDGREALPTNAEIEAVAKRLLWRSCKKWDGVESDCVAKGEDDAWNYAGEIPGFQEEYIRQAKEMLEIARKAVSE